MTAVMNLLEKFIFLSLYFYFFLIVYSMIYLFTGA
jgi:hypothetical protein